MNVSDDDYHPIPAFNDLLFCERRCVASRGCRPDDRHQWENLAWALDDDAFLGCMAGVLPLVDTGRTAYVV